MSTRAHWTFAVHRSAQRSSHKTSHIYIAVHASLMCLMGDLVNSIQILRTDGNCRSVFGVQPRDRHHLHISSWSRLASFHLHLRHQSPTFHGTVVALFHMALPHLISRADDYNIVHLLSSVRISLQLLRAHREMPFSDPSLQFSLPCQLDGTCLHGQCMS